ncbi:MAG: BTAD domain-containing putative transcriptional regulator [Burkholderiales bacterium]
MADTLVVRLLGPPRVALATAPVACTSRKALALFAFLVLSARRHPRRELAALLWGRRDEEAVRASLRVALARLPRPMADCLYADRESIGVAVAPDVDVARFEALAAADDLASLEQASELYQGELLQDFEAGGAPEFDDWLHAQRTRLAQLAQQVFDGAIARRSDRARLDASRATSERESALALARRWASLMPGSEAAHRTLMQIYLDAGRRDAAIAQYELCQRLLAVNHGRAPSPETRALYDVARGRDGTKAEPAPDRDVLPRAIVPATSFVGRVEELAELERLLADPHCRLLTLHGLGGVGKTRLAHALTTQVAPRYAQGACWVALESLGSADMLPAAVAAALGREAPAQGDHVEAVAAMLANQERLVVLDNMESMLAHEGDPLALVLRILERAPHVRILATSREVLGLQEEWIYDVRGLDFDGAPTPAVDLFVQRARQAYLGFSAPAEMPHVLRICALVEGLPLGIELAAAWVRTIPCGEIAAAIEREAAALASPHRNRADRHRTLDGVMTYSWNLLRGDEQHALAALSVFVGGFTREAAERVAAASTRTLSTLVDKSLVRRHPTGRYDLHELVRQFASAKLHKTRRAFDDAVRRHADAYVNLLLELHAQSNGSDEAAALARLRIELANINAAWQRSLEARRRDAIERAGPAYMTQLAFCAGPRAACRAGEAATSVTGLGIRADVECQIRMHWGRAAVMGGLPDVARRENAAAVTLARKSGKPALVARCLYYLASFHYQQGEVDAADAIVPEILALAQGSGEADVIALAHGIAGLLASLRSSFGLAEHQLREALASARANGKPSLVAHALGALAVPLYYRGNYDEAAAVTREAADIHQTLGRSVVAASVRANVASILLERHDVAGALQQIAVSVTMARDTADHNLLSHALNVRADIQIEQGALGDARASARESLALAEAIGNVLYATEALYLLCLVELRDGHAELAPPLLRRMRDELARKRLPLRVPKLVLATAEWLATAGDASQRRRGSGWLAVLCGLEDIDATVRDRARRLLRQWGVPESGAGETTLAQIESEVQALLDDAPR